MFPVYCVKDVTGLYPPDHSPLEGERVMSRDDDFLGARASRPHKAWHSFAYLPHFDQPGTAPLLSFQLADAVSADRVAACRIALKLSGRQAANAAGCLQRRWPSWRREASLGSQAHPGREPRSRGLGAVGQGLAGEGALAGTGCGRDARAPRGCHPAARRGMSGRRLR